MFSGAAAARGGGARQETGGPLAAGEAFGSLRQAEFCSPCSSFSFLHWYIYAIECSKQEKCGVFCLEMGNGLEARKFAGFAESNISRALVVGGKPHGSKGAGPSPEHGGTQPALHGGFAGPVEKLCKESDGAQQPLFQQPVAVARLQWKFWPPCGGNQHCSIALRRKRLACFPEAAEKSLRPGKLDGNKAATIRDCTAA